MHPLSTRLFALALLFAVVTPLFAATYIVPPDAEMIQRSDDIVVATAVTSTVERTARGGIITRYVLRIEDVLKGQRSRGSHLVLTEIGGQLPDLGLYVSGMPVYEPGERYLVFTDANRDGEPQTFGLELGRFVLEADDSGRLLALRAASGLTPNLDSFSERARDAKGFTDYIRGIVAQRIDPAPMYFVAPQTKALTPNVVIGTLDFTRRSYLLTSGPRWQSAPNARLKTALTPSGANGVNAVNDSIGKWNGTPANIAYSYDSQDDTLTSGFTAHDSQNVVLFGDPNNEVSPPVVGRGGYWTSNASYSFGGETFRAIDGGVDVVMDNITFTQCLLNVVTLHELGHTLGFRHSNQNGDDGPSPPPCVPATQDCTGTAIMNSAVGCGLTTLQNWDRTAAAVVYGAGPQCTPPGISTQPQSQSITSGNSANLTVVASGSSPFTYQWYIGTTGNTSQPTGTNSSTLNVSPTTTTSYWVRVTGQCAPAIDSNTATITVNQPTCTPAGISTHPQNRTISAGQLTSLSVTASGTGPFSYQWFIGASGDQSDPINGQTTAFIQVSPAVTTMYWVRVTGQCGGPVNSNTATVTVTTSSCPDVTVQTPTATKQTDGSFVLDVIASGGAGTLTYQWFQGPAPGVGSLINTGKPITVPAPTAPTSYWVRVSNNCGKSADSATVSIAPCDLPVISSEPADLSIASGASAMLTVGFTSASAATVRWYRGIAPDKTTEVAQGTSFNTGALTATTQFWASISNSCGEKFTRTVMVTVGSACTQPAILTISTAQSKLKGETVTLIVNAIGSPVLHYQWYEGVAGDISHPVGTDASTFTSDPLLRTTRFWVRVTNDCGNAPSIAVDVVVMQPRQRAVRH